MEIDQVMAWKGKATRGRLVPLTFPQRSISSNPTITGSPSVLQEQKVLRKQAHSCGWTLGERQIGKAEAS